MLLQFQSVSETSDVVCAERTMDQAEAVWSCKMCMRCHVEAAQ